MQDVLDFEAGPREPAGRRELLNALGKVMASGEGQALACHVLARLGIGRIIGVSETEVMGRNLGIDALRYIIEAAPAAGMNILSRLFGPQSA